MPTYHDFPDFYNNPIIQSIKDNPKWTVSDNTKCPIDMFWLEYRHVIRGAESMSEPSLTTLTKICELLPDAANNTYYLDALTDKIVVLDIEPTCPKAIKNKLLKMPYLYAETSMSGKGIHLIFPLPDCIEDYPIAQTKVRMQHENKFYEILLNHYITFTRNALPICTTPSESFEDLFREMAAKQKETIREDIDVDVMDVENIPKSEKILDLLMCQKYKKTVEHFDNDTSRYEYGHMGFLYYKLKFILNVSSIKEAHDYDDSEKAALLYTAAKDLIPYRDKHDTYREGLPWLLYIAREVIAKTKPDEKDKETNTETPDDET